MSSDTAALLAAGDGALSEGQWQLAHDSFTAALEKGPSAEADFGLATARWWLGDMPGTVAHLEKAYASFRRRSDPMLAAVSAIRLALHTGLHLGNVVAASGWT